MKEINPIVYKFSTLTERMMRVTNKMERFVTGIEPLDLGGAFEWANEAMQQAARYEVGYYMTEGFKAMEERVLDPVERIMILVEEAKRETLRKARYPTRSTSPMSNLMDEYRLAAYAEFVEEMDRTISAK